MPVRQFELVAKLGLCTLARVQGRPVDSASISTEDLEKVIEVENFLEKLLGVRFHIQVLK